jgi:hypothetical protein
VCWVCGFFGSSSTQAGYRLTFSTEGNAVGKVVRWFGDVGRQIEVGTPIGITRRDIAKHEIIQFHYCVFQYQRVLKTERYVNVRVVPLLSLINSYQGVDLEVILKYGNGDISRSSWVFRCSKDNGARDGPLLLQSTTQNLWKLIIPIIKNDKQKCPSGNSERWLHSNEPFIARKDRKSDRILTKHL